MSFWRSTKRTIAGFPCIEQSASLELVMIGKYGEIWQVDNLEYRAIIYSHRLARRYLPRNDWPTSSNDEVLIRFPWADLKKWASRLLVPKKSISQLELANEIKSTTGHPEQSS